jgi:hypothetical protein
MHSLSTIELSTSYPAQYFNVEEHARVSESFKTDAPQLPTVLP